MPKVSVSPRDYSKYSAILLAVYWCVIFTGTHLPQFGTGVIASNDKFIHFSAFAGLAFLLSVNLAKGRKPVPIFCWAFVVAVIYGAIDELTQSFVPGRLADVLDWQADSIGAVAGAVAFVVVELVWRTAKRGRSTKIEPSV